MNKVTLAPLLVALGVYGDIGSSPLYTPRALTANRNIDETIAKSTIFTSPEHL